MVETKLNVLAKCPNCETELSPYTISVSETQDNLITYACRNCETSLKLEDLKKLGRPEPKELFIGFMRISRNSDDGSKPEAWYSQCVLTICRYPHGVKIGWYQLDKSI